MTLYDFSIFLKKQKLTQTAKIISYIFPTMKIELPSLSFMEIGEVLFPVQDLD